MKPVPRLVDVSITQAAAWVAKHHRHLPRLRGGRFAVGLEDRGKFVGTGVVGNGPRVWNDTGRMIITRVAVLASPFPGAVGLEPWQADNSIHAAPYCSMIYGALCRAGKALGYVSAWTYTLPFESGKSLRAAGFTDLGLTDGGEWDRVSRPRAKAVNAEPKRRWAKGLTDETIRQIALMRQQLEQKEVA